MTKLAIQHVLHDNFALQINFSEFYTGKVDLKYKETFTILKAKAHTHFDKLISKVVLRNFIHNYF